jgi:hypothetical protein
MSKGDLDQLLLRDSLWSDPSECLGPMQGNRGKGTIMFGKDMCKKFLDSNKLKFIIRSHDVPNNNRGY